MKVTPYVYLTESQILSEDFSVLLPHEKRQKLHWMSPPAEKLDPDPMKEFLMYRNPMNPTSNLITKRKLAYQITGIPHPKPEHGHRELTYNDYLQRAIYQDQLITIPKELLKFTGAYTRFKAKQPDLVYAEYGGDLTGEGEPFNETIKTIWLCEAKTLLNLNNYTSVEHCMSGREQLLIMQSLLYDNDYAHIDKLRLKLIIYSSPELEAQYKETCELFRSLHPNDTLYSPIHIEVRNAFMLWEVLYRY